MWRVCTGDPRRDRLTARTCWCRGLFCGAGGVKASKDFSFDVRWIGFVHSAEHFERLLNQRTFFCGAAIRDKWRRRLAEQPPRPAPPPRPGRGPYRRKEFTDG